MKTARITALVTLDVEYSVDHPYKGFRDILTGEPLEPDFGGGIQIMKANVVFDDSSTSDMIQTLQEVEDANNE